MQYFKLPYSLSYKFRCTVIGLLTLLGPIYLTAQEAAVDIRWKDFKKEKIHPGLKWYQLQTTDLFASNQSINILAIQLNKRSIDLLYQPDSLIETSEYAKSVSAKAAVNAGFFNLKKGSSVTYIKKDGAVLAQNQADLKTKQSVVIRGAIVIDQKSGVQIQTPLPTLAYTKDPSVDDVLLSGPLLIEDGLSIPLDATSFNLDRHPRTCACTINKRKLLLLTVDGRNEKAAGMSLPEVNQFLKKLGCKNAINLDGGGSTTMYIAGQASKGIVNYPSDNRQFDHEGQRKVSNVLVVH